MDLNVGRAVASLVAERPEWVPVLEAAIAVSNRTAATGGEFAGAWVIDDLERRAGHRIWLPNLRVLVSYGLIEKTGGGQGGRRAYYRVREKKAVAEALERLKPDIPRPESRPQRPRFLFVGAGDSGEPASDWARRSSELPFEPRPWR